MASKKISKGLKRTALSVALGMCFAGSVYAQSNTTGNIAGQAASGDTITVDNAATGFHREVSVGADGNYRVSSLAPGTYTVTVKHADGTSSAARTVSVSIGTTASATTLSEVTVHGGGMINPIDVASVDSTTILTAEQIAKIPVPRDITGVALLAPGTVKGDAAFGNLASFGGSSVAENQYYVNGFNITNAFKNLNFGQVPFEAIAEQQVKTGGYGAEFGRSTGGVVNLVTKRGTNEFHAGGNIFITPESLRGTNPNVYTNGGLNPATGLYEASRLYANNSKDSAGNTTSASVWASGALIKDRLFGYALLQYGRRTGVETYGNELSATNSSLSQTLPTWLVKLDWNINDNHILELTAFSDKIKQETDVYANNTTGGGASGDANQNIIRTDYKGTVFDESGGNSYSLKYTGYLTDNFTLSALYGRGKSSRSNYGVTANGTVQAYTGNVGGSVPGCPIIQDVRGGGTPIANCGFIGVLGSTLGEDQRDQFRIDAEWVLGDHALKAGFDGDRFKSYDAESYEGGQRWIYLDDTTVELLVFQTGAGVEVDSKAFYIEDKWQITNNFLGYMGLRWDSFENKNGDGATFAEIKNQFGPRLGFSWDVNGDSKFKVYGNAGRYALPLTATVAVRGASKSLFYYQDFTYTGTDPVTGAPTGTTAITDIGYLNNEFGVAKNPLTIASQNLKPMYQDEYILGFQAQLTDHISGGVRGMYRDLKQAIDDQCDDRATYQWAIDNGYGASYNSLNADHPFCLLYNPGSDLVHYSDVNGDGVLELVTIGADEVWSADDELVQAGLVEAGVSKLGPKAKRTYKALDFFVEGTWDKFFLQGSYTWSKSYGNTEGGVKSDIGQDDTGTTQDFDYPELMVGSTGYLPNDRRHSFKLFGNYQITDQWSVGANVLIQSGRPENCRGIYGNDPVGYRVGYFSCDTAAPAAETTLTPGSRNNGYTIVPRGSAGTTPWSRTLDLNVAYKPSWADGHLSMKMDVFNVFNEHTATAVNEAAEATNGRPLFHSTYLTPTSFQAPRSFRFMVQYDY